jgi:hypothetical protein
MGAVVVVLTATVLITSAFVTGAHVADTRWQRRVFEARLRTAQAERRLHDLTRDTFISMAEAAERRRAGRPEA